MFTTMELLINRIYYDLAFRAIPYPYSVVEKESVRVSKRLQLKTMAVVTPREQSPLDVVH